MTPIRTDRLIPEPQVAAHADETFLVLSDPAICEGGELLMVRQARVDVENAP